MPMSLHGFEVFDEQKLILITASDTHHYLLGAFQKHFTTLIY